MITLESVPEIRSVHDRLFDILELVFVLIFAVEYFVRAAFSRPTSRYLFSFWGIVDLVSWLPAVLFASPTWVVLRVLRVARVFKLLKLPAFDRATRRLMVAFRATREQLILFVLLALITIYLSGVGIYVFENSAQPDVFRSIPHSLWWAAATLTTVGYGDIYPITLGGRLFTSAILFIGLGIIAVPTGIITSALLAADAEMADTREKSEPGETRE